MSERHPNGTLIKVTEDSSNNPNWPQGRDGMPYSKGREGVIEDYASAEESEDGHPFYWVNDNGYGTFPVDAEHVEVVKTVEAMEARRIPTMEELRDYLGSELLGDCDTFDITQTDRDGSGVEIAGKTSDGLRFAATIQITSIYETDF